MTTFNGLGATGACGPDAPEVSIRSLASLMSRVRLEMAIRIRRLTTVRFTGFPC